MNVVSTLREKRIVQIVLSYLAAGWVLLQVADQLSTRGVIPNLVYNIVLLWFAFGLIATIVLGWNHGEVGKQETSRKELITLGVLAVLALGSSGFVVRQDMTKRVARNSAEHPVELRSIAVMYFKDYTDDPQLAYIADGLTEDLIRALSPISELDVLSKNATAQFRGTDPALDSVAQVLNVGTVVDGSVEKRGDQIEVSLRLVDGRSGSIINRSKIRMAQTELLAVRDSVVEQAANLLREWIGKEINAKNSERGTRVREAWALVQRAENARKNAEAAVRSGGPAAGDEKFTAALADLDKAQKLDPNWVEPLVQRAAILYRRSRLSAAAGDAEHAVSLIDQGLQEADKALAMSPNEGRALEGRGTLRYFKYLLNVVSNAEDRRRLLADARSDLETAVGLDASLASAHSTLSHLLYNEDLSSALVEAKLAYEKDAYLEVAPDVVWRLFYGNFDLGSFNQARTWCDKGSARFRDDYRFTYCELRLMASPAVDSTKLDIKRAWQLLARIDSLAPAPRKQFEHIRGEIWVAGVLARGGLRDSSDAVLKRARAKVTADIDPSYETLSYEATVRLLMGQNEQAFELLRREIIANPEAGLKRGDQLPWIFRDLQSHPRVAQLYSRE
jgi:TolB-like protein